MISVTGGRLRGERPGWRVSRVLSLAVLLLLSSVASHAVNLQDVQFSALQGGAFEARLIFDGPPPEPEGYTIERPARIALDFPGAVNQLEERRFPLSYGNASGAVILEAGGRTRMVLNLLELVPYEVYADGNELIVQVGAQGTSRYLAETYVPPVLSDSPERPVETAEGNRITDLDFRRGEEGEGRLVVQMEDPKADISIVEEGGRINVSFAEVALPQRLRRRYDVADFATPVQQVEATSDQRGSRLSIRASGDYDYLAYQTDNEYVISVKPLTAEDEEQRRREFDYVGDKLSLNFQDIEVRAVLQLIADFTDLNLVASDTVRGSITLRLQNVPWDQALDLVLQTRGLDKRKIGNVLMVAPAQEIAERERQQLESRRQVQELAPLRSEFIRIRYADARRVSELFRGRGEGREADRVRGVMSSRGAMIVDERTNSILATDTSEHLEELRRVIQLIDVPVRQVQIEARIVRATSNFDRALGVSWGGAYAGDRVVASARREDVIDTTTGGLSPDRAGVVTDLAVGDRSGSLALGFIGSNVFLDLELSAMESRGRGEIVSSPKVITGDKESAMIQAGTKIPFPGSSAAGETQIDFEEAVLKLEVTPNITPDDRIILDLQINQDAVGQLVIPTGLGGQIPTIDTTELNTKVLVANGETVVLGGVYNTTELETITKVPFFGDIPYLGRMFRREVTDLEKQETLIFITPRILAEALVE